MLLPEARKIIAECAHHLEAAGHESHAMLMIAIFRDLIGECKGKDTGIIDPAPEPKVAPMPEKKVYAGDDCLRDPFLEAVASIHIPPHVRYGRTG